MPSMGSINVSSPHSQMLSAGGREALIQGWDLSRFLPPSTPLFNQTFFILRERLLPTKLHRDLSLRDFSFIFCQTFYHFCTLYMFIQFVAIQFINNDPCNSNIQPSVYSVWQPMPKLQLSWVRSQHPPTHWNLRGVICNSVERSTKKLKIFR